MAQLGGHAAFIESQTTQISHGDTAKEIGAIYGRYYDGIAIRQCDWNYGNRTSARWPRQPLFRCSTCSAMSTIPSKSGRPDDHHGKEGQRPAAQEDRRLRGLCRQLRQAHLGAAVSSSR
ncbi:MAG: hypothetical protein IPO15_21355 [Anaerolineae bacterium]|uniref:hypothetical protein n=1 Tax=Candidatus Amarolinea dominans TaxID=3140696 RepID=UPI00313709F6|nr:hypothetical protein [Anaerolineae bacterium]